MSTSLNTGSGIALVLAIALGGCGKTKPVEPRNDGRARAEAKRQQGACASAVAYDRLKGLLFDQAIVEHDGDRANLDTLADYSFARMEDPVVKDWDRALDITRCEGRFILTVPPGAERGLSGERRLQADIEYTAQAAADGSGFVYRLSGADAIVAKLANFSLSSGAFRPPAAIDDRQAAADAPERIEEAQADVPVPAPVAAPAPSRPARDRRSDPRDEQPLPPELSSVEPRSSSMTSVDQRTGQATVRAFYEALGRGNGSAASAQIVSEKRSSRAFSPDAMSRFYGALPEPIRLTEIVPLSRGAYRVRYRYSAGRSHCNGSAVVRLTSQGGRDLIRSIEALSGC